MLQFNKAEETEKIEEKNNQKVQSNKSEVDRTNINPSETTLTLNKNFIRCKMSRKWDPESICEIDKQGLDRIIKEYKDTNMSFEEFFFDNYFLDEFLKEEIIYMEINGNIPFQEKYFKEDDEEFRAARERATNNVKDKDVTKLSKAIAKI